jgi:L-histidine N-alpha-methyltransferase
MAAAAASRPGASWTSYATRPATCPSTSRASTCAARPGRWGEEYPEIEALPLCADFTRPLGLPACRKAAARRVVYFPGSTLGNFAPKAALALLRRTAVLCGRDGGLLLGIDLRKDPRVIEAAYNDRLGVTAAFNRNILVRINRELGADIDIEHFAHRAYYNAAQGRIEMHLVSRRDQVVRVGGMPFFFAAGESIHTENSYKYSLPALNDLAETGGIAVERVWTDERHYFSVAYLTPRHSGNDRLPGRAGGRAMLPAHETIPATL